MLGDWFIYLSVVVLVCGVVAISAINFGASPTSPMVRIPTLIAAGLLIPLSADAGLRAWRSAWVWLPIDRPRGLARFVWAALLACVFIASIVVVILTINS